MSKDTKGFTATEIALIIIVIIILAGIMIIAINPGKQASETMNFKRQSDVNAILNAVYGYAIDNNGLPANIPTSIMCSAKTNEICRTKGKCNNLVDLSAIINSKYLAGMPIDPKAVANGTGYHIAKNMSGGITVCAPHAEKNTTISVTR